MVAFALPAAAMAVLGALLLVQISDVAPLGSYSVGEYNFSITTLNLVIAILILFFAAFELIPTLRNINFRVPDPLHLIHVIKNIFSTDPFPRREQ